MKKYYKLTWYILALVLIISACKKESNHTGNKGKTLDVNFSFVIEPDPGDELIVNMYYAEEEDEAFYERQPDEVLRHDLNTQDIENGLTLTFENLKESSFAFVTAYVDVDGDSELSEGDIAICYYTKSLREVMTGVEKADNVSHRYFATMDMDQVYSTLRSFEADFTFSIPPAAGTTLFFHLYYADQEEPRFFERTPDVVVATPLTEEVIADGLNVPREDLEDRPYIYAIAFADINDNGELDHGDVVSVFNNQSVSDIWSGQTTAENIGARSRITMDLNQWFVDEDAPAVDIDGNVYTTVTINGKVWMAENLKVTRYRNGEPIATGLPDDVWSRTIAPGPGPAYAIYSHPNYTEEQMKVQYGLLYNGFAVEDPRDIAPVGWRVATDEDFQDLERAAGMETTDGINWRQNGTFSSIKLRSQIGWRLQGTDELGFKALAAGARVAAGSYSFFNDGTLNITNSRANFWTQTEGTAANTLFRRLIEDDTINRFSLNRSGTGKREGFSVRCIKVE